VSAEPSVVTIVLLVGPQASGKSTLASALGEELRRRGELVAVVELDQIAAMALPTLPGWDNAAHIFGLVAGQWARTDLTCVIAEGIASQEEVSNFLAHVPTAAALITIAVTTTFEAAWVRAQADPSRGTSRDHRFLRERYEWWSNEMARIDSDLLLDTSVVSVAQGVRLIVGAIGSAPLVVWLIAQRLGLGGPLPAP
jgi:energy-coupling factor transporter ATP-binding protein EcfA2